MHAKLTTPLSGKDFLWQLASVIYGEHEGKTVCIICEFSDGQCVVDFGVSEENEKEMYGIIHIKDMRLWIRVKSVHNIGGVVLYEKED